MVIRFGPLMTSVVLMLALVKLLAEAAVNQTEVGDAMIEQAESFPYHSQLLYWSKLDGACLGRNDDIQP